MTESHELVSVIIPAYNGEETVLDTLSSIAAEDYRPIQLIVVNDGSKDSTSLIAKRFAEENKNLGEIQVIQHPHNLGLSSSLNDGLKAASGDYVLILHQDCKLLNKNWISKAIEIMSEDSVAVVTGYYGIPDIARDTFQQRVFGILRRQFHPPSRIRREEVTFTEGKCDVYRKQPLLQIGGFPKGYRIAGEDLVISYRLRQRGLRLIKSYELPVEQKFAGQASSVAGNLKKEFAFGKAMGGVFPEFKFFLFRGIKSSDYSRSRSLHRASQPIFALLMSITLLLGLLLSPIFYYATAIVALFRYGQYVFTYNSGISQFPHQVNHPLPESLAAGIIGIATDFMYSLGMAYGLIRTGLGLGL